MVRLAETETDAIRQELRDLYGLYADLWLTPLLDEDGPVWVAASLQRLLSAEADRFRNAGDNDRADRYLAAGRIYQVALLALRGLGWDEIYHPPLVPYDEPDSTATTIAPPLPAANESHTS